MSLFAQIDLYLYALVLLVAVLISFKRIQIGNIQMRSAFTNIIMINMLLLVLEAVTWWTELRTGINAQSVNYFMNSMLLACNLLPITTWLIYLDLSLIDNQSTIKRRKMLYLLMNTMLLVMVLLNPLTDFVFIINESNMYIRQTGVYLIMLLNVGMLVAHLLSIIRYRDRISGRLTQVILYLGLIPLAGAIIQILFYGVTTIWPALALVVVITYILLIKDTMARDPLTNLMNRKQFETRIGYKLASGQAFSIVMVDIDKFKAINDAYGHDEGDTVLVIVANICERSIKWVDSVYRYGGDELMIIIESMEPNITDTIISRIKNQLHQFNVEQTKPYQINISLGAGYYVAKSDTTLSELVKLADQSMYIDKQSKNTFTS